MNNDTSLVRTIVPEWKAIADTIYPNLEKTAEQWHAAFPKRNLPQGAWVTRIGPSPTGFFHVGTLYMSLICKYFARQTAGVFFLRIEDTDKKREVEGAVDVIVNALHEFNCDPEEGMRAGTTQEAGAYGPYTQSQRVGIYNSFLHDLVAHNHAYPCFCTKEELDTNVTRQQAMSLQPGYYGEFATCRHLSAADIKAKLDAGMPFVIRIRSQALAGTFTHPDLLKGDVQFPYNHIDSVLVKTDGLPTYHLAHVVDDTLMRTTHVLRGDEWLSSVPLHHELFTLLGLEPMAYAHIAPINKLDEAQHKRKISKRKDPEANLMYFIERGYPKDAIVEYLLNLANSDFENWRKENPKAPLESFELTVARLQNSNGPLYSEEKLQSISKEVVARLSAIDVFDATVAWAQKYDEGVAELLNSNKDYWVRVFNIERGGEMSRKDLARFGDFEAVYSYFRDSVSPDWAQFSTKLSKELVRAVLTKALAEIAIPNTKEEWLAFMKKFVTELGAAPDVKTFKKEPEKYCGHIGDIVQVLRFAITGRTNTPDLFEICTVLGLEKTKARLDAALRAQSGE
jgi:glutamyl-tRNA synthetase